LLTPWTTQLLIGPAEFAADNGGNSPPFAVALFGWLLGLWGVGAALATPAPSSFLGAGEKADSSKLCEVGQERANALAANYLGRDASNSLFAQGEEPGAILAITLHTLELAEPLENTLNRRTQEAAHDVMTDPRYAGKTVVMVWEHKRIANKKLENAMSGEEVTFRQFLNLDQLPGVPETWPSGTYDYFWIAE
jgi:hypothetical protein